MSVRIKLDDTLEQKQVSNFTTLTQKSTLDLKSPDNYFAQFEHSERIF